MSDQFSPLAVRLTVSHSTPSDPSEPFAQPEDKLFHPPESDQICFGRSPSNEIPLNHAAVSGQHACIVRQGDNYFLEDMNSRNGTSLNGQRLAQGEKKLLRSGDHIRIVPYDIRFISGMEVYDQMPPTENTAMLQKSLIDSVLGGVMGHEDTPPKLILMAGGQGGMQQFELKGIHAEFRIGRAPQCDIVIQDENMSREHAFIRRDPSGVYVSDMNSRNGVLVNGRRLPRNTEHMLRDRDEITLGTVKLLFSDPEGAELAEKVGEIVPGPAEYEMGMGTGISVPQPNSPPPERPTGLDRLKNAEAQGGEAQESSFAPPEGEGDLPIPGIGVPNPEGEAPGGEGAEAAAGEEGARQGEEGEAVEVPEDVGGLTTTQVTVIAVVGIVVILGALVLLVFT